MFETRVCTFLDILGFKEIVNKADVDTPFALRIRDCLKIIQSTNLLLDDPELESVVRFVLEKNASRKIDGEIPGKTSKQLKSISFSDSLIISSEPNYEGWLNHVLALVLLTHELLSLGFLLRGGTVIGNIMIDEGIVFGKGLVDAYHLESQVSNYPRIVISDLAFENLVSNEANPGMLAKFYSSDFDGILMLNYLEEPSLRIASYKDEREIWEGMKEQNQKYATRIQKTRNAISHIVQGTVSADYRILSKLRWIAMHMNKSLMTKEYYIVPDVDIPAFKSKSI